MKSKEAHDLEKMRRRRSVNVRKSGGSVGGDLQRTMFPGRGIIETADDHVSPNTCAVAGLLVLITVFLFALSLAVSRGYENVHGPLEKLHSCDDENDVPTATMLKQWQSAAHPVAQPASQMEEGAGACPPGLHEAHGACALNIPQPSGYDPTLEDASVSPCTSLSGHVCGRWTPEYRAPWRDRSFDWADRMNALRLNHTVRSDADLTQLTGLGGDFHTMTRLCVDGARPLSAVEWLERGWAEAEGGSAYGTTGMSEEERTAWKLGWAISGGAQQQLVEIHPVRHPYKSRVVVLAVTAGRDVFEEHYASSEDFVNAWDQANPNLQLVDPPSLFRFWRQIQQEAWSEVEEFVAPWQALGKHADTGVYSERQGPGAFNALMRGWRAGLNSTLQWAPLDSAWGRSAEQLLSGTENALLWIPSTSYITRVLGVLTDGSGGTTLAAMEGFMKTLAVLDAGHAARGDMELGAGLQAKLADPMALGSGWSDWRNETHHPPHTGDTHSHASPWRTKQGAKAQTEASVDSGMLEETMEPFDESDGQSDPEEGAATWGTCSEITAHYLQEVVDDSLASHVLRGGLRDRLTRLVREAQQTWAEVARSSGRFSAEGLRRILAKQEAMALRIGTMHRIGGRAWVPPAVLDGASDWTEAQLRVRARNLAIWTLGELPWTDVPPNQRPAGERRWAMEGIVNAWFDPSENSMNIPPYILVPPFAHPSFDDVTLLAAIGFITMHESKHSTDRNGRLWDEEGGFDHHWLPHEDALPYDIFDQCLERDYTRQTTLGNYAQGYITNGEDSADVRGAQVALWTAERLGLDTSRFLGVLGQLWCSSMTRLDEYERISNPHSVPQQRIDGMARHLVMRDGTPALQAMYGCTPAGGRCAFP